MEFPITEISFKDWVWHIFDHPVTDPAWYWNDNNDRYDSGPADVTVSYLTRLMQDAGQLLKGYPKAWIDQGFWYLLAGSNYPQAIIDETVPLENRLQLVQAMGNLFADVFAVRCSHHLSHLDQAGQKPVPLNCACYMWWDVLPIHGVPQREKIDEACLEVMAHALAIPHCACQESALHGLSHWHLFYPQETERIIDGFLSRNPDLSFELRRYALNARKNAVL
jgi:hypothetical protein